MSLLTISPSIVSLFFLSLLIEVLFLKTDFRMKFLVTGISNKPNLGSIEIHSIAGALMPIDRHRKQCPNFNGFENYELLYPHFQWRTVKDQDGAFRNMPFDPQIVNIGGSTVVNLPPVFENGQRLGHNWSLKWVFDKYFEK